MNFLSANNPTLAQALREAAQTLRQQQVADARREAASLLGHVLGRGYAYLLAHDDELLADKQANEFRAAVERRAAGEPFAYIAGRKEFYGLDFEVTPDVLIPRPETELLVEKASEIINQSRTPVALCDVGAGSGCIAVALLHKHRMARAVALDISPAALRVAARNAARHGVNERLELVESDLFAALRPARQFALIASNPPYVAAADIAGLQREVRDHEPLTALTPGPDGLEIVRRLLADAPPFLADGGHLLIEIGYDQGAAARRLIDAQTWQFIDIYRDLQGHPRAVALQKITRS